MPEPRARISGIEVHRSGCASGDFDWFFFVDGTVIAKCWGCEEQPNVKLGTWRRHGSKIQVRTHQQWFGSGRGRIIEVASVDIWEDYVAMMRTAGRATIIGNDETFEAEEFTRTNSDSCDFARPHSRTPDPHAFLRQFDGEHPETFQRLLNPHELSTMPPELLRGMRNEVFARYGYRFKDPALAARFAKYEGYVPLLSNVDDFLSDMERENVKRLAAAEEATKRRPADQ